MNDLDLNDLRVYVRVVECGGFAAAARALGVPASTVSRAVARLEGRMGARLLQRTPRAIQVTAEGRTMYAGARDAVTTLERAVRLLEPGTQQPQGVLRVTAPTDLGSNFLAELAVAFGHQHPLIQLDVVLTNRLLPIVEEGFDLAIRVAPRLTDSSLVAKKAGDVCHALYAAPDYVAQHGMPSAPSDLAQHRCIAFRSRSFDVTWQLHDGSRAHDVEIRASMVADDFGYLRAATLAGGGIALMPRLGCHKDEVAGRLVRVLPRLRGSRGSVYIVYPSLAHVPARVGAFRDFLVASFTALTERAGGHDG